MHDDMMDGRPAKLQSGEWGVRINQEETPSSSDWVLIKSRDGTKQWEAQIDEVLWSGDDRFEDLGTVHLCSLMPREGREKASDRPASGRSPLGRTHTPPPRDLTTCERCGRSIDGALLERGYLVLREPDIECLSRQAEGGGPCYRQLE